MDRRTFSLVLGAAALAPNAAWGQEPEVQPEVLLAQMMGDESDSEVPVPANALMSREAVHTAWRSFQDNVYSARWPTDANSADHAHVQPARLSGQPFALTAAALESYLAHNWLSETAGEAGDTIVFGLRGCTLADEAQAPVVGNRVMLREVEPDHLTFKCVIGVWRRTSGELTVFRASTVPAAYFMYGYATEMTYIKGGQTLFVRANMMPTGVYRYVVGTHAGNQPRALRLDQRVTVQRLQFVRNTNDRAPYVFGHSTRDVWSPPANVNDNLHAAVYDAPEMPFAWKFSSAGCQVIPGAFVADANAPGGRRPVRDFAAFRQALERHDGSLEDGRAYRYVLATGRELRLHAERTALGGSQTDLALARLRPGSRHPRGPDLVAALSSRLSEGPTPGVEFDAHAAYAYTRWLRLNGRVPAVTTVTPLKARELGVTL